MMRVAGRSRDVVGARGRLWRVASSDFPHVLLQGDLATPQHEVGVYIPPFEGGIHGDLHRLGHVQPMGS